MSGNTLEVVADQIVRVERMGPLCRLVFAIPNLAIEGHEAVEDVVHVVVPTEAIPAIMGKLADAGPILRAVRNGSGVVDLVAGGRDVGTCRGRC